MSPAWRGLLCSQYVIGVVSPLATLPLPSDLEGCCRARAWGPGRDGSGSEQIVLGIGKPGRVDPVGYKRVRDNVGDITKVEMDSKCRKIRGHRLTPDRGVGQLSCAASAVCLPRSVGC